MSFLEKLFGSKKEEPEAPETEAKEEVVEEKPESEEVQAETPEEKKE
jgi:hypothetical protein